MAYLNEKTRIAKASGFITKKEKKWKPAFIINDQGKHKASIRLKGDWADHINNNAFSFRLKLEDAFWKRLSSFSLLLPETRDYLNEWIYHKMLSKEGVLTPRYGFVEVEINSTGKGLYAYEEHFSKQLIEYNNRREGPILKFNEDRLWEIRKIRSGFEDGVPIFDPATIEGFKMQKILQSPTLKKAFTCGQSLMYNFKFGLMSASQVFDIKLMAKFIAIMDINKAHHNFIWHNLRFYYNPIIQKLEPIGFDGFTSEGASKWVTAPFLGYYKTYNSNYIDNNSGYIQNLFCDSAFVNAYIHYLSAFSDTSYIETFLNNYTADINMIESAIQVDSIQYKYDHRFLYSNAEKIRNSLPAFLSKVKSKGTPKVPLGMNKILEPAIKILNNPKYFINSYRSSDSTLEIENFIPEEVTLIGAGKKKKKKRTYNIIIPAYKGINYKSPENIRFNYRSSRFLFFKTISNDKEFYESLLFTIEIQDPVHRSNEDPKKNLSNYKKDILEHHTSNSVINFPIKYEISFKYKNMSYLITN